MKQLIKRKRILSLFLCAALVLTACGTAEIVEPVPSEAPVTETTVETTMADEGFTVGDEPLYDGILRTLANGDSFFTPGTGHSVTDADSSVLYYNNLLLVFTVGDLAPEDRAALAESLGGEALGCISGGIHAFQILVPDGTLSHLTAMAEGLLQFDTVLYACPEYPVQIMGKKTDNNPWTFEGETEEDLGNEENPGGLDWWAEAIGAYTAWEYADQCQDIRVGIVDDGFFAEHEDLQNKITFVTNDNCNTAADHGTHVAGIIAAVDNDIGIRGIADTAQLYCADLWPTDDPDAYHTMAEYLAVINYMAQLGVRVVNNSWACVYPGDYPWEEIWTEFQGDYEELLELRLTRDLIPTAEYAIVLIAQLMMAGYEDMILVQGAGNSGVDARYMGFFDSVTEEIYNDLPSSVLEKLTVAGITYEIIDERILVVGAVENIRDDQGNYQITWFSNYGEPLDIYAPGMDIFSTVPSEYGFYYTAFSGTSMAAPMVTGSIAFLWSLDPELTVRELRQILLGSCQVQAVGNGTYPMLNVGAAAQAVVQ